MRVGDFHSEFHYTVEREGEVCGGGGRDGIGEMIGRRDLPFSLSLLCGSDLAIRYTHKSRV